MNKKQNKFYILYDIITWSEKDKKHFLLVQIYEDSVLMIFDNKPESSYHDSIKRVKLTIDNIKRLEQNKSISDVSFGTEIKVEVINNKLKVYE
jgi:hypothetical protein